MAAAFVSGMNTSEDRLRIESPCSAITHYRLFRDPLVSYQVPGEATVFYWLRSMQQSFPQCYFFTFILNGIC